MSLAELLHLANTVLEAAIVILISSVLLYGIAASIRSRVALASNLLLAFTVVAYLGDLFLTQVSTLAEMEQWLRAQWLGIAFVPSAYLHLSVALVELSGRTPRQRWGRLAVFLAYGLGAVALALAALTELIVRSPVVNVAAPQLRPGPAFPVFAVLFGGFIALGVGYQLKARRGSRTATMRRRITYIIASAVGPVISVFPYLVLTGQSTLVPSTLFWAFQVVGNSVVGITVFFMTYSVAYFGVREPDRVVRLRLIKFLARGPLVAIGVLVLLVVAARTGQFLGLPSQKATPFVVVAGIVVLQWIILIIKPALERWFYFDERDQVVRIQELRDRVLTTRDLRQFLESVLATVCELLQAEDAFIASIQSDGTPQVELIVGDPTPVNGELTLVDWRLRRPGAGSGEGFAWNGYKIVPLYDRVQETMIGLLGVHAPAGAAELDSDKERQLDRLLGQAAAALEDRLLQQQVFEAMEGLLRQVEQSRWQRAALDADGALVDGDLLRRTDFTGIVRDALSHYWGGPKLTESPLLGLTVVKQSEQDHQGSSVNAMRAVLLQAIESLRPEGSRSMTTAEWILYNILELKFVKGYKVRDIARRLAMSESDLYRKQRIAVEAVARAIIEMEQAATLETSAAETHAEADRD